MKYSAPKLIDCENAGSPESPTELFIVEGDSAARTLTRVRDSTFQAILPMQGKPMNATKARLEDLQKNIQFAALIKALGVDLTAAMDRPSELLKLRYQKIILLFDPDADGIHGRTLMLLFFYRWLRPLLDAGHIYDAHAPQWEITGTGLNQAVYAATPEYLKQVRSYLADQGITKIITKRFRGLGSVDVGILKSRCVDPETRTLTPLSAAYADQAIAIFEQMREFKRE
jgi:DNA gyrase subunit B/topoisomerase-4 subunit B